MLPPKSLYRSSGLATMGRACLLVHVFASSTSLRKNSKRPPWNEFVPDLVAMVRMPPEARHIPPKERFCSGCEIQRWHQRSEYW